MDGRNGQSPLTLTCGGVIDVVENYDKSIARVISGLAANDPEYIRSIVEYVPSLLPSLIRPDKSVHS